MRAIIILLTLTLVFVSGSVFNEFFVENEINKMVDDVNKISTTDDLKAVIKKWEKLSEKLEIIIDHGDLEEVSQHLWAMEEEILYDFDEFMESKALTLQMLSHIKDRNTLALVNVL